MEWERQRTYDFENGKEAKAIEAATNMLKKITLLMILQKLLVFPFKKSSNFRKMLRKRCKG